MPKQSHLDFERLATYEDTIQRSVHEHEVLIAFNNDDDADQFRNWMLTEGEASFLAYRER